MSAIAAWMWILLWPVGLLYLCWIMTSGEIWIRKKTSSKWFGEPVRIASEYVFVFFAIYLFVGWMFSIAGILSLWEPECTFCTGV